MKKQRNAYWVTAKVKVWVSAENEMEASDLAFRLLNRQAFRGRAETQDITKMEIVLLPDSESITV